MPSGGLPTEAGINLAREIWLQAVNSSRRRLPRRDVVRVARNRPARDLRGQGVVMLDFHRTGGERKRQAEQQTGDGSPQAGGDRSRVR